VSNNNQRTYDPNGVKKFIKTPESGNIVKVYLGNKSTSFGRVVSIVAGLNEERERGETARFREIAVLEELPERVASFKIDYYLPETSVMFRNY
jgi:hypothetical protein